LPNDGKIRIAVKADLPGEKNAVNTSLDIPMGKAALLTRGDSTTVVIIRPTLDTPVLPAARR
jgi:hypothetical protein